MTAILPLFFLSGVAALIYELVWFRALGLIFGNTVHAAATTSAAYMLGLALGAHLASRLAQRWRSPLVLFGWLEMAIAIFGLSMPLLMRLIQTAYACAFRAGLDNPAALTGIRVALAFFIMAVPTACMGATLPVLSQAIRNRRQFAMHLGWLYAANTFGAVTGIALCGFLLLPRFGMLASTGTGVALNVIVASLAWILAATVASPASGNATSPRDPDRHDTGRVQPVERQTGAAKNRLLFITAGVTGFVALGFEVAWFRTLILIFGSTTYSYTVMLAVFLAGIGLGGVLLGVFPERIRHDLGIVIVALLGMGLYSLLSLHWFNAQPDTFLASLVEGQFAWSSLLMAKCRMAVLFLFPVALLSGLLFTAVASVIRGTSTGPTHALVGSVVMWNTLGATIGALVTGFFLLPRLGMERSLLILAWAALVWSLPLAWMTSRRMRWLSVGIVILGGGLATIGTPHWDPKLMSAGAFFSPWNHVENGQVKLRQHLQAERLEYYKEGLTSTVSVTRTVDERLFFCSNGKVEADTTPRSMVLQRLIGHLPMLLHPNPQAVLNIGLGAGVTLGSLACYPVEQLDVVEIEPAVRGVAHIWQERNHDVMSRSDIRFIVNDGRNHLLLTQDRYDVITSDPFEPVVAGAASLFTVDHFSLARSRLNPGGVMGQFLPLYEMSSDDFRMIVRSFAKVFPRSLLFFTGHDTILVGFTDDHDLTFETIAAKFKIPAVRDSLAEIGLVRPESILDALVVDLSRDASIAGDGAVNTDRHPYIEFSTPRSALQYQPDINQRVLLEHMNAIPAELLRGLSSEQRTRAERGHEGLSLALRANLARSAGNLKANIDLLRDAVAAAPENRIIRNELAASLLASAMLMLRQNNITQAIVQFQLVLQYEPDAFWPLYHLVSLCMRQGDTEQADHYMSLALTAFPDAPLMIALRAKMRGTNRDFNGARADMERALEALPGQPELWADYATLLELAGDAASAATAREKAAQLRR